MMKSPTAFLLRIFPRRFDFWFVLLASLVGSVTRADEVPQKLPFAQDWSNPALITRDDDWAKVPGLMGYRGDKLASRPGASPQTITNDGSATPVSVLANQKNPNSLRVGGVAEFDSISDPTIALKGSATAPAPMLVLNLEAKGKQNITVSYKLRDLDAAAHNSVQAVALQYRMGTNGPFTDIATAFAPDVTTRPGLALLLTPITVVLPAEVNDQAHVQVRWITTNAEGDDEWVGIDDIAVIGEVLMTDKATQPVATAGQGAETSRAAQTAKD